MEELCWNQVILYLNLLPLYLSLKQQVHFFDSEDLEGENSVLRDTDMIGSRHGSFNEEAMYEDYRGAVNVSNREGGRKGCKDTGKGK